MGEARVGCKIAIVSEMVARIMRSNTSVGFKSVIYSGKTRMGEVRRECKGVNQESRVKAHQEAQEQTQTDLSRSRSPRFSTRYFKLLQPAKVMSRLPTRQSSTENRISQ